MSMEIKGTNNPPPAVADKAEPAASSTPGHSVTGDRTAAGVSSGADTFRLTNKAAQLQQLEAQIASLPEVDTQRVHEVQHALSSGSLEVNPARVADKLLTFEAGLEPQH